MDERYRPPECGFCNAADHALCDPTAGRGCECWCGIDLDPPPIPDQRTPP